MFTQKYGAKLSFRLPSRPNEEVKRSLENGCT